MSIAIGPTDRDRFSDEPVLSFFHPEGYVSQQKGQQGRMELEDNDFVGMVVGVRTSDDEARRRARNGQERGRKSLSFQRGQSPMLLGSLQHGDRGTRYKRGVEADVLLSGLSFPNGGGSKGAHSACKAFEEALLQSYKGPPKSRGRHDFD